MTYYVWTPDEGHRWCSSEAEARSIVSYWLDMWATRPDPGNPYPAGERGPEWGVLTLTPSERRVSDGAGGWVRS